MHARPLATLGLLVAVALSFLVVAPAATAAGSAACAPTISMDKPFQDVGGMLIFPASFTLCENSRVTVKDFDRDDPTVAGLGSGYWPAGPGHTYTGLCQPDGKAHRWGAYATVKTSDGTLLAKSATVYLKTKPVTGNCAPYNPCTSPVITAGRPYQDSTGYVTISTTYTACDAARVTIKFRDRDQAGSGWAEASTSAAANSTATRYAGSCIDDGLPHRYVMYATMKPPVGSTLLAQTEKVYFTATAVSACGTWNPPTA